jgi:peptidoglycan-associated lipoprotein
MTTRGMVLVLFSLLGCKREVLESDVSTPPVDDPPAECRDDSCAPPLCATDDECPSQQICDGGQCVHFEREPGEAVCGIATLYFAFESAKLTPNNQERLASAAPCLIELLKLGGELVLEVQADVSEQVLESYGHDTTSMLADRRGGSVREYLISVGVPGDQLRVVDQSSEARGVDETYRAPNRRVRLVHVPP